MKPLKIQGSTSSPEKVNTYFTEYSFKIDKRKIKKLAIEACLKDSQCGVYLRDTASVLNSLYHWITEKYADSAENIYYYQEQLYQE